MATQRSYACNTCMKETRPPHLFDALRYFSTLRKCECGGTKDLILNFDFGLDADKSRCKVLDAFIPANDKPDQWSSDGGNVTFYPFLVILEGTEKPGRSIWLPYWHTVEGQKKVRPVGTSYG